MADITPTAEDLARDLRADLDVCEKATPGPWQAEGQHLATVCGKERTVWSPIAGQPGVNPKDGVPVEECIGADVQRQILSDEEYDRRMQIVQASEAANFEEMKRRTAPGEPIEFEDYIPTAAPLQTESIATFRDTSNVYDYTSGATLNLDQVEIRPRDALFIATARTALPAYIRRTHAAETRLAEIRDAMTEYLRHADLEDRVAAQSAWTDLMRLINPKPPTT